MPDDLQELSGWYEWKRLCSFDKCIGAEAVKDLLDAIYNGLKNRSGHQGDASGYRNGWSAFESYCYLRHTKAGKRYKDHLFLNASESNNPLHSLRGQCKRWLLSIFSAEWKTVNKQTSYDCYSNDDGTPLPMTDALSVSGYDSSFTSEASYTPTLMPSSAAENEEYKRIAEALCNRFYDKLKAPDLVVVAFSVLGIGPTSAKALALLNNKSSSTVNEWVKNFARNPVFREIDTVYSEEDPQSLQYLRLKVIEELGRLLLNNIFSEKRVAKYSLLISELEKYRDSAAWGTKNGTTAET